ncbi:hypothetical protein BH10ACT3_BH10ACT3_16970 [soil metagenome]
MTMRRTRGMASLRPAGRVLLPLVAVVLAVMTSARLAAADSAVGLAQNPVPVTSDQSTVSVAVNWNGLVPGQLVYLDVCRKSIIDWSFNVAEDCAAYSRSTPNGTGSGSGSASIELFRGQDPAGEAWGCYAPGDTPPPGVVVYETCFVRVTDTELANFDNDSEVAFTFEGSTRVDPGANVDGAEVAQAPTLPGGAGSVAVPSSPTAPAAPTGDPAPGESIMVAGSATGAGVSIAG